MSLRTALAVAHTWGTAAEERSLQTIGGPGKTEVSKDENAGPVDAVVTVSRPDGTNAAQGRTYVSASSNPKSFTLEPGSYVVTITAVKPTGLQPAKVEVEVRADAGVEHVAELVANSAP